MTDHLSTAWEPTTDDLVDLQRFGAELMLRFGGDGSLEWANDAALAHLRPPGDRPAVARITLEQLDGAAEATAAPSGLVTPGLVAPGLAMPGWASVAAASAVPPGAGTGPHVGPVRRPGGGTAWWEWSAWRDDAGVLFVLASDVTGEARGAWLQQARQRGLEALVEAAAAGIAVRAVDGRLVLANRQYRDWFPSAPDGPAPLAPPDQQVLALGASTTADETVDTALGRRTLLTVRFPLRDTAGRVAHVAMVATDITARIEAETELADQQRLLDTLVRVSPDVVAMVGRDKRPVEVSDALSTVLGMPGPLPKHELGLHVHPDDVAPLAAWLDAVLAGTERGRFRHRLIRADGRVVHLDAVGRAVRDDTGAVSGAVLVSRDVSAAVDVETELQRAVGIAEDASRAKSSFLSRISRELRNPLESVLAMAEHLEHRRVGQPPLEASQREAVEHIDRAGRHLQALIDEVLDVAHVERRGVELVPEPVAVGQLVDEAVGLARPLGEARGVLVAVATPEAPAVPEVSAATVDQPAADRPSPDRPGPPSGRGPGGPWVWADRQRLLQVLLNLLSNAVKYNRPQGTVRVSVSTAGHRVRLAVADTGVGIAPEHLHRLFEPFDRLGAEHTGVEGTGVGLTLTKHLVEQMDGTVEVASVVGTGTVFVVDLPAAAAPSAPPAGGVATPPRRTVRVLHVEDDPASGELVRQLLERRGGVDLVQVGDGHGVLALARRHRPDLVLLDLNLPDVGGEAVLAQLRADADTAAIPVVVVSADATDTQVARLEAAGAAAYLTKPLAVGQLLALVDAAGDRGGGPGAGAEPADGGRGGGR